jgi:FtsP/CotA-like multicopper oxidase with cupredoxin domain
MKSLTRRTLLAGGAAAAGLVVAQRMWSPAQSASNAALGTASVSAVPSSAAAATAVPDLGTLHVPPLLSPPVVGGMRMFALALQRGQMAFEPGRSLQTLGINGPYLGPTLRASQGDMVMFSVANGFGEPTTVHWHGMHLPAMMDGGPHQMIADGGTWHSDFAIRQQAATLWYHPHLMGQTLAQVSQGAVGMFILDDANPAQRALPHDYGVDDIPLILQEYGVTGGRLTADNQGPTLVNGSLAPRLVTDRPRLRLRILNATNEQIFSLGFATNLPFAQVASDGGLLGAPVSMTRLQLGVGERAEIVLDFANIPDGTSIVLQRFGGGGGGGRGGGTAAGDLMTIRGPGRAAAQAANLPALPSPANSIVRFDPSKVAVTRPMVLGGAGNRRTINGLSMATTADMENMANTFRVRHGDLERWNVINQSDDTHVFHVHDVQFQILARNGAAPGPTEAGRKDSVVVRQGETVSLVMQFVDYTDAAMPYMYHCHILEHEDQGMMGQFVVVPRRSIDV